MRLFTFINHGEKTAVSTYILRMGKATSAFAASRGILRQLRGFFRSNFIILQIVNAMFLDCFITYA